MKLFLTMKIVVVVSFVTMILTPVYSSARVFAYQAVTNNTCDCQLSSADYTSQGDNECPENCPEQKHDGSCDSEEGCSDAVEPTSSTNFILNGFQKTECYTNTGNRLPEVYFTIYVPPES
jgi:hypothetical protein